MIVTVKSSWCLHIGFGLIDYISNFSIWHPVIRIEQFYIAHKVDKLRTGCGRNRPYCEWNRPLFEKNNPIVSEIDHAVSDLKLLNSITGVRGVK